GIFSGCRPAFAQAPYRQTMSQPAVRPPLPAPEAFSSFATPSPSLSQIMASGSGRRHEAMDKSIWRPAKDRPPVQVFAPQHGAIRYRDPAGVVGIVRKDQDFPTALFDPRLRRRTVTHRAARFSIRVDERAIPRCKRVRALMRHDNSGCEAD